MAWILICFSNISFWLKINLVNLNFLATTINYSRNPSMTKSWSDAIKSINYWFKSFDSFFFSKFFIAKPFFHISLILVIVPCKACNHSLAPFLPIESIFIAQIHAHLCSTTPHLHFWEIVRHLLWELLSEHPS